MLTILEKARAILALPEHWCQQSYARSSTGEKLSDVTDPTACSWCMLGAVEKIEDSFSVVRQVGHHLEQAARALGYRVNRIIDFNDSHTHQEVLRVFDKAIENERTRISQEG